MPSSPRRYRARDREMGEKSPEKKSGCGLLNAVFGRRSNLARRTPSSASLPRVDNVDLVKAPTATTPIPISRRRKGALVEATPAKTKPFINEDQPRAIHSHHLTQGIKPPQSVVSPSSHHPTDYGNQARKVPKEAIGISGELENIIADHQKFRGTGNLVRASSSNVMLFGNLGNLRQSGGGTTANSYNHVLDYLPKTANEDRPIPNGKHHNVEDLRVSSVRQPLPPSLCRALSTRMDPETLKIMGNEDYKNGRFAEALALYDAAISIDPNKASYRSNKSAALTALGRLLEAVFECREAIRIDPHYHRAHHRLATLYLRLGEAEKAMYHYKHAGPEGDPEDLVKAKTLQAHLTRCTEARRIKDWNTLVKETGSAIAAGADSAPQIYALQAEASLKLHKPQQADEALSKAPKFEVDECTKFFGPVSHASLLVIRAQVDMASGRFEDAIEAAQLGARLDPNNREMKTVMRRATAVAAARSNGNELFNASRFTEACSAYGEGLEHDPYSAVLLCNRAACRSKLGLFEKALEDCSAALNARPSYTKARLRRADCNAKMGKWEEAIMDYEIIVREAETEVDEEVKRALFEAQVQLKKRRGERAP